MLAIGLFCRQEAAWSLREYCGIVASVAARSRGGGKRSARKTPALALSKRPRHSGQARIR
jgi:hypothetical protein